MTLKRVRLTHSREEWTIIQEKLKQLEVRDIQSYLRSEIHKLNRKFIECPSCICSENSKEKVERLTYVTEAEYEILKRISVRAKYPVAALIDNLFIIPLLNGNYEAIGNAS